MQLNSLNVSGLVETVWQGKAVTTGIFKEPVSGRRAVTRAGVEGDRQADPRFHGGEFKAVYAYSADDYSWWEAQLGRKLVPGAFGENLTVAGLVDEELCVGDTLRVGTALLQAVQPRQPCWKLAMRYNDPGMVKRFQESGRWGVYFRVLEEGEAGAGDSVEVERRDPGRFPVPLLTRMTLAAPRDPALVARALSLSALPPEWAEKLGRGDSR